MSRRGIRRGIGRRAGGLCAFVCVFLAADLVGAEAPLLEFGDGGFGVDRLAGRTTAGFALTGPVVDGVDVLPGGIDLGLGHTICEDAVYANARMETRHDDLERCRRWRVALLQVLRNDADMLPEFPYVPAVAPENAKGRSGIDDGIQLTIERLEQGCLARPVRADDRDTLVLPDFEIEIFENERRAAPDGRAPNFNERRFRLHGSSSRRGGTR